MNVCDPAVKDGEVVAFISGHDRRLIVVRRQDLIQSNSTKLKLFKMYKLSLTAADWRRLADWLLPS
jgi:hypothetical protein